MKDFKCPYYDNANFSDATNPNKEVRQTNTNKTKLSPISDFFIKLHEKIDREGNVIDFNQCLYNDKVELILGNNHEIKVVDNKTYVVKKQPQYPNTYEECCDTLYRNSTHNACYEASLQGHPIQIFARLLICLDAYWKIAGEEMGLDKPWEPDWDNLSTNHEFIKIKKGCFEYSSRVLAFPTAEMRDAFYENFKELIEQCKELL